MSEELKAKVSQLTDALAKSEAKAEELAKQIKQLSPPEPSIDVGGVSIAKSAVGDQAFELLTKQQAEAEALKDQIAKAEAEQKLEAIAKQAQDDYPHLPLEPANLALIISKAGGDDLTKLLKSANEAIGKFTTKRGKTGGNKGDDDDPLAKVEALAKAMQTEKGIPFAKAYDQVLTDNPDLYTAYREAQQ